MILSVRMACYYSKKHLYYYLITEQIGDALYGIISKSFIFTRRTGKAGNP